MLCSAQVGACYFLRWLNQNLQCFKQAIASGFSSAILDSALCSTSHSCATVENLNSAFYADSLWTITFCKMLAANLWSSQSLHPRCVTSCLPSQVGQSIVGYIDDVVCQIEIEKCLHIVDCRLTLLKLQFHVKLQCMSCISRTRSVGTSTDGGTC